MPTPPITLEEIRAAMKVQNGSFHGSFANQNHVQEIQKWADRCAFLVARVEELEHFAGSILDRRRVDRGL